MEVGRKVQTGYLRPTPPLADTSGHILPLLSPSPAAMQRVCPLKDNILPTPMPYVNIVYAAHAWPFASNHEPLVNASN